MSPDNVPVCTSSTLFYQLAQYFIIDVVVASFLSGCRENQEPRLVSRKLLYQCDSIVAKEGRQIEEGLLRVFTDVRMEPFLDGPISYRLSQRGM
ncbi:hypothetical protein ES703_118282 [subsurface metagenome]